MKTSVIKVSLVVVLAALLGLGAISQLQNPLENLVRRFQPVTNGAIKVTLGSAGLTIHTVKDPQGNVISVSTDYPFEDEYGHLYWYELAPHERIGGDVGDSYMLYVHDGKVISMSSPLSIMYDYTALMAMEPQPKAGELATVTNFSHNGDMLSAQVTGPACIEPQFARDYQVHCFTSTFLVYEGDRVNNGKFLVINGQLLVSIGPTDEEDWHVIAKIPVDPATLDPEHFQILDVPTGKPQPAS